MNPYNFPEANLAFVAPESLEESQCGTLRGYVGNVERGSIEGSPIIVVAWTPTAEEREKIAMGFPIFLSFMSHGLPPHYPSMSFQEATHPA